VFPRPTEASFPTAILGAALSPRTIQTDFYTSNGRS